mmetsp:Transcript_17857/g.32288  ORF Transcript_17857/g.32288 Transcript_17857/m.32288 type:complete len:95 (-) Transcript_17857:454-738(-)
MKFMHIISLCSDKKSLRAFDEIYLIIVHLPHIVHSLPPAVLPATALFVSYWQPMIGPRSTPMLKYKIPVVQRPSHPGRRCPFQNQAAGTTSELA